MALFTLTSVKSSESPLNGTSALQIMYFGEYKRVWVHLDVILCDLDLSCVDVVYQQAQSPAVHLLYPHSFRPALCHLTCWYTSVGLPLPHRT